MGNGRDAYAELLREIRSQSRRQQPQLWCLGTVLQAPPDPLLIRAAGLELDEEDLLVNPALLGPSEETSLAIESGTVSGSSGGGISFSATINSGSVSGMLTRQDAFLQAGDQVVLLPDQDGQIYYVLCKVVRP